jgi:hypothetical protein
MPEGVIVCPHPVLVEALADDRIAELRRNATAGARVQRGRRRSAALNAARQSAGWLLVEAGLRLAVSDNVMNRHHSLTGGR